MSPLSPSVGGMPPTDAADNRDPYDSKKIAECQR